MNGGMNTTRKMETIAKRKTNFDGDDNDDYYNLM